MTDDRMPFDPAGEADASAAELALGLLEGDERAAALRRVIADPDFARDVEHWRARFASLAGGSPDVAPPADGWQRLEQAIAAPPPPAPVAIPVARPGLWRPWAITASALAAGLALVLVVRAPPLTPPPAPPPIVVAQARPPVLVAPIVAAKAGATIAAVYDPAAGQLKLGPATLADAAHSAELWVIPADGTPRSLGLLANGGETVLRVAPGNRAHFADGATLAVTVEPVGGSPSGKPTGPIVASGALITA